MRADVGVKTTAVRTALLLAGLSGYGLSMALFVRAGLGLVLGGAIGNALDQRDKEIDEPVFLCQFAEVNRGPTSSIATISASIADCLSSSTHCYLCEYLCQLG